MKQSNYDFLNKIDNDLYLAMIKRGIIPINIMTYRTIYDTYLSELSNNRKSVAITFCADKYNVTERTIRNVINFMDC